jgi:hypothetical protein
MADCGQGMCRSRSDVAATVTGTAATAARVARLSSAKAVGSFLAAAAGGGGGKTHQRAFLRTLRGHVPRKIIGR